MSSPRQKENCLGPGIGRVIFVVVANGCENMPHPIKLGMLAFCEAYRKLPADFVCLLWCDLTR